MTIKSIDPKERYKIACAVKPERGQDQYLIENMKTHYVWPWKDENDGYEPPSWVYSGKPPAHIAAMMKKGGNPFIVDGKISPERIAMGYDGAMAEAEYLASKEPEIIPAAEEEHPVCETFGAAFGAPMYPASMPQVPGIPIPPNMFQGQDPGQVTAVAEVGDEVMVDPTAAWGTAMPVEDGVPPVQYPQPQIQHPQQQYLWDPIYMAQMAGMMAQPQQAQQLQTVPVPQPVASIPLQAQQPKKPPKPKKAEADKDVNPAGPPVTVMPNKRDVPVVVQEPAMEAKAPVAHQVPEYPLLSVFSSNLSYYGTKELGYLQEIEQIALENGVQVCFGNHLDANGNFDGLVYCQAYDPSGKNPNPYKSFTIDTGVIIDRRHKVFCCAPEGHVLEQYTAYEVFLHGGTKAKGGGKRLDRDLFRDIFVGGTAAIANRPPMYSKEFMELNRHVELISLDTRSLNKDKRKHIQNDLLLSALKRGTFKKIEEIVPKSRFRFTGSYDAATDSITCTNVGVPVFYNGPVIATKPVTIKFTTNDAEVTIG
ncbi:hypothetical protein [uncultured Duncaniella sp.]|uniref:hypothetical protein n=1 Tax=uncultured Duncaniella sp. TaxID=2768039 RepID=UPI00262BC6AB|nr:hypothetical protein [uncultured Duncaniella sp.]